MNCLNITQKLVLALLIVSYAGMLAADAPGVDPEALAIQLGMLPQVDSYEVDASGHVTTLNGILVAANGDDPFVTVKKFLAINKVIFPRVSESKFHVRQVLQASPESQAVTLTVGQSVRGFEILSKGLVFTFDDVGNLVGVSGRVCHDGDVETIDPGTFTPQPESKALYTGEMVVIKEVGGIVLKQSAKTVLLVKQGGPWVWRVDNIVDLNGDWYEVVVNLRAENLSLIGYSQNLIQVDYDWFFAKAGVETKTAGPKNIVNCDESPSPPGDFTTREGFEEWANIGMGFWEFNKDNSKFTPTFLEYLCPLPVGSSPCNYGAFVRNQSFVLPHDGDPSLPKYTRIKMQFVNTPDSPMAFRWGPTQNEVVPFTVENCIFSPDGCTVELNLEDFPNQLATWLNGNPKQLMVELGNNTDPGYIKILDILPGPYLEFCAGFDTNACDPEFAIHSVEGGPYPQKRVEIEYQFRNNGCDFSTSDSARGVGDSDDDAPHPQQIVSFYRTPQSCSGGQCDDSCASAGDKIRWFTRAAPPLDSNQNGTAIFRSSPDYGFIRYPAAGCWKLHGEFDDNHASASLPTYFEVEESPVPWFEIDNSLPIDYWSIGSTGHYGRLDSIDIKDITDAKHILFPYHLGGVSERPTLTVSAYLRPHDPDGGVNHCRLPLPDTANQDPNGWTPLDFRSLDSDDPSQAGEISFKLDCYLPEDECFAEVPIDSETYWPKFPTGQSWGIYDLYLEVEPLSDDPYLEDNRICIPGWTAISDGPLPTAISSVRGSEPFLNCWFGTDYGDSRCTEQFINTQDVAGESILDSGFDIEAFYGTYRYQYDRQDGLPPRIVFNKPIPDGDNITGLISGVMMRVRRGGPLTDGEPYAPYVAGGTDRDDIPTAIGDLTPNDGHPATNWIPADNQWRTVLYRIGDTDPFGDDQAPILIKLNEDDTPSGSVLTFEIEPDTLLVDPSNPGTYPYTYIDFLNAFVDSTFPVAQNPFPSLIVEEVEINGRETVWQPLPNVVEAGSSHTLGLKVVNPNPDSGDWLLEAELSVTDDLGRTTTVFSTGPDAVLIHFDPNGEVILHFDENLDPWIFNFPQSGGVFNLSGTVTVGGSAEEIGGPVVAVVTDFAVLDIGTWLGGEWVELPDRPEAGTCYPLSLMIINNSDSEVSRWFTGPSLTITSPFSGVTTLVGDDPGWFTFQPGQIHQMPLDPLEPWCPDEGGFHQFSATIDVSEAPNLPLETLPSLNTAFEIVCPQPAVALP